MPRVAERERQAATEKVSKYVASVLRSDSPTAAKLTQSTVAKVLHISRDTLRKHGLDVLIADARAQLANAHNRVDKVDKKRLLVALADRYKWKKRYFATLEKYITLENYLRHHESVDVDAILDESLPKALRAVPARSTSPSRSRRERWAGH